MHLSFPNATKLESSIGNDDKKTSSSSCSFTDIELAEELASKILLASELIAL